MKASLYNQRGDKVGETEISESVFNIPLNPDLLYQTVLYYENLSRRPIAKTKDRSEVRGGGRKPWRQKGTGRARHGSIRSPLWKGGGVTFGPTPEKKFQVKVPKKVKKKALFMALSRKLKEGEIIFVDKIKIKEPKTKVLKEILQTFVKIKKDIEEKRTTIILEKKDKNLWRAARNIKKVSLVGIHSLNPHILLKNKYILIEKGAVKQLEQLTTANQ